MARVKLGAFITEISGSLGGATFQKSASGMSLKTKNNNCDRQTPAQLAQRAILLQVQRAWQVLSDDQRSAWHFNIENFQPRSSKDYALKISGRELFLRWNCLLLSAGYGLVLSPDFNQSYTIDSDFSLYADDLSFIAVFDTDPSTQDKGFLLNLSRSGPSSYVPVKSSAKRVAALTLGSGGYDLLQSYLSSHAVAPVPDQSVSGNIRQFNILAPFVGGIRKFFKSVFPLSDLPIGVAWVSIALPTAFNYFYRVAYLGNGIVIAVTASPGLILRSVDYGRNFTVVTSAFSSLTFITIFVTSLGYIVVGCQGSNSILVSKDMGLSFSISLNLAPSTSCYSVGELLSGSIVFATGQSSKLFVAPAALSLYSVLHDFAPDTRVNTVFVTKSGRILCFVYPSFSIMYSDDEGTSFFASSPVPLTGIIMKFLELSNGSIIAINQPQGIIYSSTDNGVTWSVLYQFPTRTPLQNVIDAGDGKLIACSSSVPRIFISFDFGLTWSLSATLQPSGSALALCSLPNGSLMAGGGNPGFIYRSNIFPNA